MPPIPPPPPPPQVAEAGGRKTDSKAAAKTRRAKFVSIGERKYRSDEPEINATVTGNPLKSGRK